MRHEYATVFEARRFAHALEYEHLARGNALTYGNTTNQHLPGAFEGERAHIGGAFVGAYRFGTRLYDVQRARFSILRPFDVHGPRVVLFNAGAPSCEKQHVVIGETAYCTLLGRGVHIHGVMICPQNHFHLLESCEMIEDGTHRTFTQERFEDAPFVGVHGAFHDILAEAPGAADHHHRTESRFGVERERHPGGPAVTAYHLLHPHRQGNDGVLHAVQLSIGNRPIGEKRGETPNDRVAQRLFAHHVEIALLLPREAGIGKVFGRGGTAHGHRW